MAYNAKIGGHFNIFTFVNAFIHFTNSLTSVVTTNLANRGSNRFLILHFAKSEPAGRPVLCEKLSLFPCTQSLSFKGFQYHGDSFV